MIKCTFISVLLMMTSVTFGQNINGETAIETVNRILTDYMRATENQDIDENKDAMIRALYILQDSTDKKDFEILVQAWLNYSPPNFPTRKLIEPIFYKDKVDAIEQINQLLVHNDTYAGRNTFPGSDLIRLRDKIYKH